MSSIFSATARSSIASPFSKDDIVSMVSKSNLPKTVDIELRLLEGRNFVHTDRSIFKSYKPSYSVEMVCGGVRERSVLSHIGDITPRWNTTFVFAASLSTTLDLKVHCREGHLVGEISLDPLKLSRSEDVTVEIFGVTKASARSPTGQLILRLKVSWAVKFSDAQSDPDLRGMRYMDIINSISPEQIRTLSPAWQRFLSSFSGVLVQAKYIAQVNQFTIVAATAVAFAVKVVVDQVLRDEKIDRLVQIMANLYSYFCDAGRIKLILTYRRTLARLFNQTTETAHFIANYRKVKTFTQRAMIHMTSDADNMINQFEEAFGELKIELIMGSSLQTAVVSFRILQKVENIESLMYINLLPYLKRATWDPDRCCLVGTRDAVIDELVQWVNNIGNQHHSRLYILTGPEGCGKSTIAHTICQTFHHGNRLGAAVFTQNYAEQKVNASTLCSTIAFQLANYDARIRHRMARLIESNSHLAYADVTRQFPDLIVAAVQDFAMIGPVLIVIDGLSDAAEQAKLITVLAKHSFYLPPNFRILLSSRPQKVITSVAGNTTLQHVHVIDFDESEEGNLGIEDYLSKSVERIFAAKPMLQKRLTIADLVQQLTPRALGIRFWATTACRWISSCMDESALILIQHLLSSPVPLTKEEAMDNLYHIVLQSLPDRISAYRILEPLVKTGMVPLSSRNLDLCLTYPGLIIQAEFANGKKDSSHLFRLHPSFEDFLTNPGRCNEAFCVQRNLPIGYSLWEPSIDELNSFLRHNICDLSDPVMSNDEVSDREERIHTFIPASLQYACQHWIYHLELASSHFSPSDIQVAFRKIRKFLFTHLLHWIELMSILGELDLVLPSLRTLALWLKRRGVSGNDELYQMTREGILFIGCFSTLIAKNALQIYVSALSLMPSDTLLFRVYQQDNNSGMTNLTSDLKSGWTIINDPMAKKLPLKTQFSTFASFRYLLACAQSFPSRRIRFYDSRSWLRVGIDIPLDIVSSMDLSPNGKRIAVAGRGIFGIWDVQSGACIRAIEAGPNWPSGVILSGDGSSIIGIVNTSPSTYEAIAWDVKTAQRLTQFKLESCKNKDYRVPITLSPDARILAGPTPDGLGLQFLDVRTGKHPSVMLSDPSSSNMLSLQPNLKAAFWSRDGSLLATYTMTPALSLYQIQIWSTNTNQAPLELEGNFPGLKWLTFSPENSCVAGLYQDASQKKMSICSAAIWNSYTGKLEWSSVIQFESGWMHEWRHCISFMADGHEVFFFPGLHCRPLRLVRLPGHFAYPSSFSTNPPATIIQYTKLTKNVPLSFAPQVDVDGWICDLAGNRHLWVPYSNHQIYSEKADEEHDEPESLTLQRTILGVKHPQTKNLLMKFEIEFKLQTQC